MSDAIDRDAAIRELEKAIYRSMPTRIVIGGAAIDCPTPEGADEMQRRIAGWFRDALRSLPAVPPSPGVAEAVRLAVEYGDIDGDHHKAWVIDQMVRALTGAKYEEVVREAKAGKDGPDTYEWDEGVAP